MEGLSTSGLRAGRNQRHCLPMDPHRTKREKGWKFGIFVNGTGAFLSFVVLLIISVTKFTHGAWFIMLLVPILVVVLVRLNRQYEAEARELERLDLQLRTLAHKPELADRKPKALSSKPTPE